MTAVYGLIGKHIGGSFSREFFAGKFAAEGVDAEYRNFELDHIGELTRMRAENPGLRGFNVTSPYKERVIAYLDAVDPSAARIGAVNCVRVGTDGRLTGYNTDAPGFRDSLLTFIGTLRPRALVLGTGGAASAVVHALGEIGIEYSTVSRTAGKGPLTYNDLSPDIIRHHLLIINATPLGMGPLTDLAPAIPYEALGGEHMLFDLIYNPPETLFLARGRERGARTCNGYDMLVNQAEASWEIWNR